MNYFLEAQDYSIKTTVVYQDNKSAILLKKNGKQSSSTRTKHINVHYYFITNHINTKELNVKYCNTDDMVADYFTKPLQGCKFLQVCKKIMNL